MKFNLPDKIINGATSEIRDMMDRAATIPGCISFGIGNPAPDAIPVAEIKEAIQDILDGDPMVILQYGPAIGYKPLIDLTIEHLVNDKGFDREGNALTLLNGSGHGLGLLPRTLCNEGDVVFADEFSFPNGVNGPRGVGCVVKAIPMDKYGMIPSALEKEAKKGGGKYIYLIPNFQNPTGLTIPLERRKELYEIAVKYDLVIYEDDPYGEIRFAGENVPCFKNIDYDNRVIFAGSYSKVMSAGIRVGYLYGNSELINECQKLKASSDGQQALLNQIIVYNTLKKVDYKPYIQNICDIYGKKCKIMVDAIEKYLPKEFTFVAPEGGMFLWLETPECINQEEFFEKALENKVCIISSKGFATDINQNSGHAFRLNYTAVTDENIVEGIKRLGEVCCGFVK
ncbi:MAG: PLP-dependent aminotransferase family protein [Bacillota bacterium]